MSKIIGCLFSLLAIGCSGKEPVTSLCPTLPSGSSVRATAHQGPDFWDCEFTSEASEPLFSVYIGNHPDVPRDLRYGGTTESEYRNLAWFSDPGGSVSGPRTWRTFLPTGDETSSVAMAWFTSSGPDDFHRRAEIVAQLRLVQ